MKLKPIFFIFLSFLFFQASLYAYLTDALRKVKGADCIDHLRQIHLAAMQYAMDSDGHMPAAQGNALEIAKLYAPYLPNPEIFMCSGVQGHGSYQGGWNHFTSEDLDYGFGLGPGGRGVSVDQSGKFPVAFDRLGDGDHERGKLSKIGKNIRFNRNHGLTGGNIVFLDGSLVWVQSGKSWEEFQIDSNLEFVQ